MQNWMGRLSLGKGLFNLICLEFMEQKKILSTYEAVFFSFGDQTLATCYKLLDNSSQWPNLYESKY